MAQVDTLCVGRYWSKVLCCTITTHLSDLKVNVMGHRFIRFSGKAQVRRATLSCDSSYSAYWLTHSLTTRHLDAFLAHLSRQAHKVSL